MEHTPEWNQNMQQGIDVPPDTQSLLDAVSQIEKWEKDGGMEAKMLIQTFLIHRFIDLCEQRLEWFHAINETRLMISWIEKFAYKIQSHLDEWKKYRKSPFLMHIILSEVYGSSESEERCRRALLLESRRDIEMQLRIALSSINFLWIIRQLHGNFEIKGSAHTHMSDTRNRIRERLEPTSIRNLIR